MSRPKAGYRLADGTRVPGVTTITGRFKDSGALMQWAYRQGMRAERGEISSLYDSRDRAADAGTLAHEILEAHLRGIEHQMPPGTPDDVREEAERAADMARTWLEQTGIDVRPFEAPLVSEELRIGGTPDALGYVGDNRRPALLDWKTGGIYPETLVQVSAYALILEECEGLRVEEAHAVSFPRDGGGFQHRMWTREQLECGGHYFRLLREAYELDKRVKGWVR